jgi:hypothetical protein
MDCTRAAGDHTRLGGRARARSACWIGALAAALASFVAAAAASPAVAAGAPCPPAASTPLLTPPRLAPTAPPAPEQVIACVGTTAITGATYSHWAAIADKSQGGKKHHHASTPGGAVTKQEVLGFLLSSDWLLGEAQALNVSVSEADARRGYDRIRDQQFPRRREFHEFLRTSGETVADLLFRVRVNLTSERVMKHVAAAQKGERAKLQALARFVAAFKRRWTAQTYCSSAYAVPDCGHVF